jgi:NOL1/NOP2/fmu family ribosome biogenesis protein
MAKLDFEVLEKEDKKRLLNELAIYGIEKLPYLIVKWGKRLRIFSGSIDKDTIFLLLRKTNIDSMGLYFASQEDGIRLSLDAAHLLQPQIRDGILEVNEEQTQQWFRGKDIGLTESQKKEIESFGGKFIILKNNGYIIGIGKKSFCGIANFLPKERRVKG